MKDTVKTILQGALGACTFGAYHQFTTNAIMDLNNKNMDLKQQELMNQMELKHKKEMDELKEHIKHLENKRWF